LLVAVGVAYIDLAALRGAMTWKLLSTVTLAVAGAVVGALGVARFVGTPARDSVLVAGLCVSNMGGSGDVACLAAAQRLELMPFAQVTSRIAGSVVVVVATLALRWL
jgi:Na+/citrate or Na+/malate symporter